MKNMLATILALVLAVSGASAARAQLVKLSTGDVAPISASWPSFVAQGRGMFREHGLDVTINYAGSAAAAVQQLVGGAFDVSLATFDSTLRAAAVGAPIAVIGATAVKYPYSVMSAPDIRTAQDLQGKTIILSFQKDITTVIWNRWLRDNGVEPGSVDQVYDGATPNRFAALSAKRVQAAFLGAPFDFRAQHDGFVKLLDFGATVKDVPFVVLIARRDWLRDHAESARNYMAAMAEAIRWIDDPANREAAAAILAKDTKQSQELALQTYDAYVTQLHMFTPTLEVPPGAIMTVGAMLAELGDIKSATAIPATLVDPSFLPR